MTVDPYDDINILGTDLLIRRIDPKQHIISDENLGCLRISSKAFHPSSEPNGGLSVDVKSIIDAAGIDAKLYVTNPKQIGSVAFRTAAARAVELIVGFDPEPDNPYHGQVWGNFSRSQEKALLNAIEWFVEIPDVKITRK